MCINVANERLQMFFNERVFQQEQHECFLEGVVMTTVSFSSNQPVINLFLEVSLIRGRLGSKIVSYIGGHFFSLFFFFFFFWGGVCVFGGGGGGVFWWGGGWGNFKIVARAISISRITHLRYKCCRIIFGISLFMVPTCTLQLVNQRLKLGDIFIKFRISGLTEEGSGLQVLELNILQPWE